MFEAEKQNLEKKIEGNYYAIIIILNVKLKKILGSG